MQTIIFDFGNVVAFFDHYRTLNRLAALTELPLEQIYANVYQGELEDSFERGALLERHFLAQVRALAQLRCDDCFLTEAIADIFWPNPEVCELIPTLKKRYRLLLGSNTNAIHSTHFRRQFADVLGHFDGLVLSHEVGLRKPGADFFHHCLGLAQAPADQCLFVDDIPANVEGAKSIGMKGLVYKPDNGLAGKLSALGFPI